MKKRVREYSLTRFLLLGSIINADHENISNLSLLMLHGCA